LEEADIDGDEEHASRQGEQLPAQNAVALRNETERDMSWQTSPGKFRADSLLWV
jgi:hypothetical protein